MDHDVAGEVRASQIAGDFFAIAMQALGKAGVHKAEIVIEKNQLEGFGRQNFERGRGRHREAHPRHSLPKPVEAILGVIEDEYAPVSWDMEGHALNLASFDAPG
jgi:hypothetical protein